MARSNKKHSITAIIYDKRGRVLSIGKNTYVKTHPLQKRLANKVGLPHKEFLHAEISAIVKCRDLSKAYKITVLRFNKDGSAALAKPCPICEQAIEAAGIKHVSHT